MPNFKKPSPGQLQRAAFTLLFCALPCFFSQTAATAQQKGKTNAPVATPTPAFKRTTSRHEVRRFSYGSTLTIVGAPAGSITIEAWPKNEVDITADIELYANSEEELALLAPINDFAIDEDVNHLRILTTGTHDTKFMKRVAKKFPKQLLNLPWKIDYRIRVPAICDLDIEAGRGAFSLSGVEGSIILNALESNATMTLTGGVVIATIGAGSVKVNVPTRSWRGAGADIRLAVGDLTVELPPGFSGDINADVLRTGQIENTYTELVPQERTSSTPRSIKGRAGVGGATLSLKVTDGTLRIQKAVTSDK